MSAKLRGAQVYCGSYHDLQHLRDLNLIVGDNGVGKSSVLHDVAWAGNGLVCDMGATHPYQPLSGWTEESLSFARVVFPKRVIELACASEDARSPWVKVVVDDEDVSPKEGRLWSLLSLGWHVSHLVSCKKAEDEARVLCLDSVWEGVHHSHLKALWETLFAQVERHDFQLFTTTQSIDVIHAFALARTDREKALYRLNRDSPATHFTQDEIARLIERGMDPR